MKRSSLAAGALICLSLGLALPARAQDQSAADAQVTEKAKALYRKGEVQFNLGHYPEALKLFEEAYTVKQIPALLYNIAQSHRLAGNLAGAVATYNAFLRTSPNSPNAPVAREKVAELERLLRAQNDSRTAPPTGLADDPRAHADSTTPLADPPFRIVLATPQSSPATSAAPAAATARPVPAQVQASTPLYQKWWVWTAVGAAAAGVTVVALTSGGNTAPGSHFGTTKVF